MTFVKTLNTQVYFTTNAANLKTSTISPFGKFLAKTSCHHIRETLAAETSQSHTIRANTVQHTTQSCNHYYYHQLPSACIHQPQLLLLLQQTSKHITWLYYHYNHTT